MRYVQAVHAGAMWHAGRARGVPGEACVGHGAAGSSAGAGRYCWVVHAQELHYRTAPRLRPPAWGHSPPPASGSTHAMHRRSHASLSLAFKVAVNPDSQTMWVSAGPVHVQVAGPLTRPPHPAGPRAPGGFWGAPSCSSCCRSCCTPSDAQPSTMLTTPAPLLPGPKPSASNSAGSAWGGAAPCQPPALAALPGATEASTPASGGLPVRGACLCLFGRSGRLCPRSRCFSDCSWPPLSSRPWRRPGSCSW
jgi:hypothetical protein